MYILSKLLVLQFAEKCLALRLKLLFCRLYHDCRSHFVAVKIINCKLPCCVENNCIENFEIAPSFSTPLKSSSDESEICNEEKNESSIFEISKRQEKRLNYQR